MQSRIAHFFLGELLAFVALFFGGLALLGGAITWTGSSRHPAALSWTLVALFGIVAGFVARAAALRLRRAFPRPR